MHTLRSFPNFNNLEVSAPNCKAVLWDMDGTILNTEILHTKAVYNLAAKNTPTSEKKIEAICYGQTDQKIFDQLKANKLLSSDLTLEDFIRAKDDQIMEEVQLSQGTSILDSKISDYIVKLKSHGLKQAIVTSSEKNLTLRLLTYFKLKDNFDLIITREDTKENKPSPMPYLKAMKELNTKPEETLIYEDSVIGLKAATQSKAITLKAQWY